MEMYEQILDQLMSAVDNGEPLDFAEALDTALKAKAADAIDQRRIELASSIHESKDEEEELEEEDDEYSNKSSQDKEGSGDADDIEDDDEDGGSGDADDQMDEAAKYGETIKVTNAKVGVKKAGDDNKNIKWNPKPSDVLSLNKKNK